MRWVSLRLHLSYELDEVRNVRINDGVLVIKR
jgi:hypothetical protein